MNVMNQLKRERRRRRGKDDLKRRLTIFSGCILMPEKEFKKAFKSGCNSQTLSCQFNVSQDALWVRIGQLRLV